MFSGRCRLPTPSTKEKIIRIRGVSLVVTCVFAFLTTAHADYKGINESCNTRGQGCRGHLVCKDGYCAMPSFLSGATVSCKQELAKKGVDMRSYVSVYGGDGTGGIATTMRGHVRGDQARNDGDPSNARDQRDAVGRLRKEQVVRRDGEVRFARGDPPVHVSSVSGTGMLFDQRTPEQCEADAKESVSYPIIEGLQVLPRALAEARGFHLTSMGAQSPIPGIDEIDANDPRAVDAFLTKPATVEALEKVSAEAKAAADKAHADSKRICSNCKYCIAPPD